ncbi:TIGR02677 family protein [Pseudosporangium ferrugineum]|uniref:TIGR02677 family protein n=1 Tax=Pseudosporangium ferrugineum TaxID=439699 RepID=UPI001304B37D|nr:TIGR02677 family protein [Pseudosporangium ferrugineum]
MEEPEEDLARLSAFAYLTAPEHADYLAIMRLFTASLMADLSAQQVVEGLAGRGVNLSLDTAVNRLEKLKGWGNLLPSSHTVRVKSIEEYQRARSRYQLSPLGERVQRQADEVLSSADTAREISRELLGLINVGLANLADRVAAPGGIDGTTARETVATVFAQFWAFRDSVRDFYAFLGQVLARYDLDTGEYAGFKDLLLDYIESITEEIVLLAPRIERHLDRLWPHLPALIATLRADGLAGAAAGAGVVIQAGRGQEAADWAGLRAWFADVDGRRSEVTQLRDATLRALQSLLANAKRLVRSTGRGTSRRRELLRLAAWLDAADEDSAADIFSSAFGSHGARHLGIAPEPEAVVPATTSWWPVASVEVPVALRERGVRAARGRAAGLPDRSAQQRALVEAAAAEQQRRAAAAAELLSAGDDLGAVWLSAPAIQLVLELTARALGAGDPALGGAVTVLDDLELRCELISKPRSILTLRSVTGDFTIEDLGIVIGRVETPGD